MLTSLHCNRFYVSTHARTHTRTHAVNGRSWGEIGIALGVSRQAARERFAEKARA